MMKLTIAFFMALAAADAAEVHARRNYGSVNNGDYKGDPKVPAATVVPSFPSSVYSSSSPSSTPCDESVPSSSVCSSSASISTPCSIPSSSFFDSSIPSSSFFDSSVPSSSIFDISSSVPSSSVPVETAPVVSSTASIESASDIVSTITDTIVVTISTPTPVESSIPIPFTTAEPTPTHIVPAGDKDYPDAPLKDEGGSCPAPVVVTETVYATVYPTLEPSTPTPPEDHYPDYPASISIQSSVSALYPIGNATSTVGPTGTATYPRSTAPPDAMATPASGNDDGSHNGYGATPKHDAHPETNPDPAGNKPSDEKNKPSAESNDPAADPNKPAPNAEASPAPVDNGYGTS